MKSTIALIAGLTLLAANVANASKARLEALGQDMNGSLYIEDNRNILLNPAAVTKFGNFVLIEGGTAGDDTTAPDAQGGFVLEAGGLSYGVFLGHEDATTRAALVDGGFPAPENTVEFIVGGQAGVAWGASLWYSSVDGTLMEDVDHDGNPATDPIDLPNEDNIMQSFGVRLGASTDMWQAYTHLALGTTAENSAGDEFEGTSSVEVGGAYNLGTGSIYAKYAMGGYETTASGADTVETTSSGYELGWANKQEIEENAFFFYSVAYAAGMSEVGDDEQSESYLPITAGFEAQANTWLALRASVRQPILINSAEASDFAFSRGDDTQVGAGASLVFDKLRVDGTAFSGGTLNTSDLLGRVALTYQF